MKKQGTTVIAACPRPFQCDAAGASEVIYIEVVAGLGETLVSNTPGTALRCTARKELLESLDGSAAEGCLQIEGFPSKSQMLVADTQQSCIIFRSDSNGEDLEGYAFCDLSPDTRRQICAFPKSTLSEDHRCGNIRIDGPKSCSLLVAAHHLARQEMVVLRRVSCRLKLDMCASQKWTLMLQVCWCWSV